MQKTPTPFRLHNLAHIELNAIDLAWDTVVRFSSLDLDPQFYSDFAHVADDESRHLLWCLQRLQELGVAYGDMPAHDLLWQGAQASSGDVVARMAVVPMGQEARGLDAGGRLAERLVGLGDARSARIVARIALEERAHVAVGAWGDAQLTMIVAWRSRRRRRRRRCCCCCCGGGGGVAQHSPHGSAPPALQGWHGFGPCWRVTGAMRSWERASVRRWRHVAQTFSKVCSRDRNRNTLSSAVASSTVFCGGHM